MKHKKAKKETDRFAEVRRILGARYSKLSFRRSYRTRSHSTTEYLQGLQKTAGKVKKFDAPELLRRRNEIRDA
jgi:hypothetical protein